MGKSRKRAAAAVHGGRRGGRRSRPDLRASVAHGDLAFVNEPVVVGHYEGDTLVGAERQLDRELGGRLGKRRLLGLYPGPVETYEVVLNQDRYGRPGGAIVIGLGRIGELSPGDLRRSFAKAVRGYAMQSAEESSRKRLALRVVSLLIGTGAGFLSIEDSMSAVIEGTLQANEELAEGGLGKRVRIREVRFLELYLDQAIQACRALRRMVRQARFAGVLEADEELWTFPGGRRRITFDEAPGWWRRLQIKQTEDGSLRFTSLTDRARAEVDLQPTQRHLVDNFVNEAVVRTESDPELAASLFELLVPDRLKEHAPDERNLVLVLDDRTAAYPWELLEDVRDRGEGEARPLAVRAGLVRQLETTEFRRQVTASLGDSALVVGDPPSSFPPLPQAQAEAELVARALGGAGFAVTDLVGEDFHEVIRALFARPYRVLHLAGHGVYRFPVAAPEAGAARHVTGMVLGDDVFLTPAEIEQMRDVPELVFLNCCYLGRIEDAEPDPALGAGRHALAANVSTQLIRMGVRAVVAAGWAVSDAAAETFAGVFYRELLDGARFGSAVRRAREAAWNGFPGVNTWGAYQCYGDPDYVLRARAAKRGREPEAPVTADEVLVDLENMTQEARTVAEADLPELVGRARWLEAEVERRWSSRGDLRAVLGRLWGQLGDFERAVGHYEAAVRAGKARITVEALEQLANLRSRWAVERGQRTLVDRSLAELRRLPGPKHVGAKPGWTVERLCLLAAAYKRRAQISGEDGDLDRMVDHYRQAHELALETRGRIDNYPLLNWLAGRLVVRYRSGRGDLDDVPGWLEKAAAEIRQRDRRSPDFWNGADAGTRKLLEHLAAGDLEKARSQRGVVAAYRAARRRGSPREFRSVLEHLDWMVRALGSRRGRGARAQARRQAHRALLAIHERLEEEAAEPAPEPEPEPEAEPRSGGFS